MLDGLGSSIILGGFITDWYNYPTVPDFIINIHTQSYFSNIIYSKSTDNIINYGKSSKYYTLVTKTYRI